MEMVKTNQVNAVTNLDESINMEFVNMNRLFIYIWSNHVHFLSC